MLSSTSAKGKDENRRAICVGCALRGCGRSAEGNNADQGVLARPWGRELQDSASFGTMQVCSGVKQWQREAGVTHPTVLIL